jgi:hypothetical protein
MIPDGAQVHSDRGRVQAENIETYIVQGIINIKKELR